MDTRGGKIITVIGIGFVIGTLFLPWQSLLTGIQRLMLDNFPGYFASWETVCSYSSVCVLEPSATILLLLGGVMCVVGLRYPYAGIVGGALGTCSPIAIFLFDLVDHELDKTGLGVYLCMIGFVVALIGSIIHVKAAGGGQAFKGKTKYGKYVP